MLSMCKFHSKAQWVTVTLIAECTTPPVQDALVGGGGGCSALATCLTERGPARGGHPPCRDFSCIHSHSTPECDEAFST